MQECQILIDNLFYLSLLSSVVLDVTDGNCVVGDWGVGVDVVSLVVY